jgi:hypothetical protein
MNQKFRGQICTTAVIGSYKHEFKVISWRHDTQHNDIQHKDTQHNELTCDTKYNELIYDTQHNSS